MIRDYIALDLETTGLSPEKDRIIEIGAVKYVNGEPQQEFATLVKTYQLLPERITALTGITEEMLADGMEERDAVLAFLEFAGETPVLLGHNIGFDYSFVKMAALRYGRSFECDGLDTLRFAKAHHPELESRTLTALCAHYGIAQEHAHRAVDDSVSAHRLYLAMLDEFPEGDGFFAVPLVYKPKKQEPMTPKQNKFLRDLLWFHGMEYTREMELLTKSDASRLIDKLILAKGRMPRE